MAKLKKTKPRAKVPEPATAPAIAAEEHGGAPGPDPVRYGDWERKGIAVDF